MKSRKQKDVTRAGRSRDGRFNAGTSGNPRGRPKGSLNRTTLAAMALLESEAEMLTARAIDAAREGDMSALKLVIDRLIPPRRRPILQLDLDALETIPDQVQAHRRVIQAALDGGLSVDEAERLSKLVELHIQISDLRTLEWRAQRYLWAAMRRCFELRKRLMTQSDPESTGTVSPEPKPPDDEGGFCNFITLYVAALAYWYDCSELDVNHAWSALPLWERERVKLASRHFPEMCPLPEEASLPPTSATPTRPVTPTF